MLCKMLKDQVPFENSSPKKLESTDSLFQKVLVSEQTLLILFCVTYVKHKLSELLRFLTKKKCTGQIFENFTNLQEINEYPL